MVENPDVYSKKTSISQDRPEHPPAADAVFQVREQELAVEGVDGGDVGEDISDHLRRK